MLLSLIFGFGTPRFSGFVRDWRSSISAMVPSAAISSLMINIKLGTVMMVISSVLDHSVGVFNRHEIVSGSNSKPHSGKAGAR